MTVAVAMPRIGVYESTRKPDLFDFQVNGFAGVDFQQDNLTIHEWIRATTALERHRTSSIFATFVTAEMDRLCRRLEAVEYYRARNPVINRVVAGYHLEGPWLSPEPGFRGAHPPSPMHAPSEVEFELLQSAAGGLIRLVTLAPEWPGSAEFIAALVRKGVHVSLGHTNASDDQIDAAISAGARFATHLGNGMPLLVHRHDNVMQRLLSRDELTACFIPDGIHLPPHVLRNCFRAKAPDKVLFTTDCMAGAGAPPGRYSIGGIEVDVGLDRVARNPDGGGFAGSSLAPDEGLQRIAGYLGLTADAALDYWSTAPMKAFGVT